MPQRSDESGFPPGRNRREIVAWSAVAWEAPMKRFHELLDVIGLVAGAAVFILFLALMAFH
jgi:hypothetical protein